MRTKNALTRFELPSRGDIWSFGEKYSLVYKHCLTNLIRYLILRNFALYLADLFVSIIRMQTLVSQGLILTILLKFHFLLSPALYPSPLSKYLLRILQLEFDFFKFYQKYCKFCFVWGALIYMVHKYKTYFGLSGRVLISNIGSLVCMCM